MKPATTSPSLFRIDVTMHTQKGEFGIIRESFDGWFIHRFSRRERLLAFVYLLVVLLLLRDMIEYTWTREQIQNSTLNINPIQPASIRWNSPKSKYIKYGNYCVHRDVIAPILDEYDRIGQVLHVSADWLDERIIEQVTVWNAPVSMTIVLTSPEQYSCAKSFVRNLSSLHVPIRSFLRAHLLFPISWSPSCLPPPVQPNCTRQAPTIESMAKYPANVARNVARMFSYTSFIVLTDFEHLFSKGFEPKVRELAKVQLVKQPHSVLVYRIFELDESIKNLPKDKKELQNLYNQHKAVVFHEMFYKDGHQIEGLKEWFDRNMSTSTLGITEVKYTRAIWEPQFVSLKTIPMHDESFPFLIRDNTVLRWELCRADYSFYVMEDVFMIHRGIKRKKPASMQMIQKANMPRFESAMTQFKARMNSMYPTTINKCPVYMM